MSRTRRDNVAARKKQGQKAYDKRSKRQASRHFACNLCGQPTRAKNITGGLCLKCFAGPKTELDKQIIESMEKKNAGTT